MSLQTQLINPDGVELVEFAGNIVFVPTPSILNHYRIFITAQSGFS